MLGLGCVIYCSTPWVFRVVIVQNEIRADDFPFIKRNGNGVAQSDSEKAEAFNGQLT